jgi:hypothetical protein
MVVGKDGNLRCVMLSSVNDYARLSAANLLNVQVKNATTDAKQTTSATVATQAAAPAASDPTKALLEILSKALVENPSAHNLGSSAQGNPKIINGHYVQTPLGLRDLNYDPKAIRDITLAEFEESFYASSGLGETVRVYTVDSKNENDYLLRPATHIYTDGRPPDQANAFLTALKNRTLKFTSTADVPGLHYHSVDYLIRDASGEVIGNGSSTESITGTENISKTLGADHFFINSNGGYREKGATEGIIISW